MANIDVSDLLDDPDLSDTFQVVRTTITVGNDGVSTKVEQILTAVGSVQPASGDTLALLPEASRVEGALEVWSRFAFQLADDTHEADRVLWRGRRALVIKRDDYGHYGSGYSHVTCVFEGTTD